MDYYSVKVPTVSNITVICKGMDDLFDHLRLCLEEPGVDVTIRLTEMPAEEVEALGEFDGY